MYAPMGHDKIMTKMITIIEFSLFLSQVGVSISVAERDELIDFLAGCLMEGMTL
jgi:hypothetical protein